MGSVCPSLGFFKAADWRCGVLGTPGDLGKEATQGRTRRGGTGLQPSNGTPYQPRTTDLWIWQEGELPVLFKSLKYGWEFLESSG